MRAIFSRQSRAPAVAAGVEERADPAVVVAQDDHGRASYLEGEVIPGPGDLRDQPRLQPVPLENGVAIELVGLGIDVQALRK